MDSKAILEDFVLTNDLIQLLDDFVRSHDEPDVQWQCVRMAIGELSLYSRELGKLIFSQPGS